MSSHLATMCKVVFTLATFAAAFAGHQWWSSRSSDAEHGGTDQASVSSEDLLQELQENVAELAKLAEQPDNVGQVDSADYERELITRIDATLQTILQRRDDADANFVAAARMMQLHAYFFASMRRPQLYCEPLTILASELERDLPNSDYAFQASVLRFASRHDFTQPLDAEGVRALMDQACGDLPPRQGVAFYCFVSDQLYSNGQTASAKAVLDAGLERFRGQAGWHDLFQRQFDQGHIEAPPQVAGGAFPTESFQPLASSEPRRPSTGPSRRSGFRFHLCRRQRDRGHAGEAEQRRAR